jgi:palmitoyltransferase
MGVFFYIDLESLSSAYDRGTEGTCFLGSTICGYFQFDTWTLSLTIWILIQLSWSVFLLGVQLYQIAVATTTNESANSHRYAYMNEGGGGLLAAAVTTGGTVAGTDGPSPPPQAAAHQGHNHGGAAGFLPCLQLFAGARALHRTRARRTASGHQRIGGGNPFDNGCLKNCMEFWTEDCEQPGSVGGGKKDKGKSSQQVNWYNVYNVQDIMNQRYDSSSLA